MGVSSYPHISSDDNHIIVKSLTEEKKIRVEQHNEPVQDAIKGQCLYIELAVINNPLSLTVRFMNGEYFPAGELGSLDLFILPHIAKSDPSALVFIRNDGKIYDLEDISILRSPLLKETIFQDTTPGSLRANYASLPRDPGIPNIVQLSKRPLEAVVYELSRGNERYEPFILSSAVLDASRIFVRGDILRLFTRRQQ